MWTFERGYLRVNKGSAEVKWLDGGTVPPFNEPYNIYLFLIWWIRIKIYCSQLTETNEIRKRYIDQNNQTFLYSWSIGNIVAILSLNRQVSLIFDFTPPLSTPPGQVSSSWNSFLTFAGFVKARHQNGFSISIWNLSRTGGGLGDWPFQNLFWALSGQVPDKNGKSILMASLRGPQTISNNVRSSFELFLKVIFKPKFWTSSILTKYVF